MSKTIMINFRVTLEEEALLKAQAKGMKFSSFIRHKLLCDLEPANKVQVDLKVRKRKITKTSAIDFASSPVLPAYRRGVEPGALLKK